LEAASSCSFGTPNPVYFGGPVVQNAKIYAVFWTANVDPAVSANIAQFYTDIAGSSYLDWLSEYGTVGVTPVDLGTSTNQGISRGSFGGTFTITPSKCAGTSACTVTDADLKAELAAQFTSGALPAPTKGCDGQTNSIYMIEFPANVTITYPLGGTTTSSCSQFCSYHESVTVAGQAVPYGVLPSLASPSACNGVCGKNGTAVYADTTSVHSATLVNVITNPAVAINTVGYTRPSGWGDQSCGQIGDVCNFQEQQITVNGHAYTVQQAWSRIAHDCIVARTVAPVCTGPGTPSGCRACTCADDNLSTGCNGAAPWCETTAGDVKAGTCAACTRDSQCGGGTCAKSSTLAQDDVCVAPPDGGMDAPGSTDAGAGGSGADGGTDASGGRGGAAGVGGGAAGTTGAGGAAGTTGAGGAAGTTGAGGAAGTTGGGGQAGAGAGSERGPCYGNGTCNAGLVCLSDICVKPADAGTGSGGSSKGCGCQTGPASQGAPSALLLLAAAVVVARGRRRSRRASRRD
jgi:MYXO-CTERM domain-containing protein